MMEQQNRNSTVTKLLDAFLTPMTERRRKVFLIFLFGVIPVFGLVCYFFVARSPDIDLLTSMEFSVLVVPFAYGLTYWGYWHNKLCDFVQEHETLDAIVQWLLELPWFIGLIIIALPYLNIMWPITFMCGPFYFIRDLIRFIKK